MEREEWIRKNIAGGEQLYEWFGYWPSFHDAEVTEVHFSRSGASWLKIHAWHTTNDVDSSNYFITNKDVVVMFKLSGVLELELNEFNHQNVIFGLELKAVEEGIELELEPCFGVSGRVVAKRVEIEIAPGKPVD
ncbi:MAG TPA: Imm50 family immunity protein [Candidatus Melainabacteria bacterium]|nr:Imm50 family immunity protein [Candidatus Melainabacteria bacterium]